MTKQEQINKYLTEQFLGWCWHNLKAARTIDESGNWDWCHRCTLCGEEDPQSNQDLHTPEGFFLLWGKMQQQEWFRRFEMLHMQPITKDIINPQTFPELLARYLGWKEE